MIVKFKIILFLLLLTLGGCFYREERQNSVAQNSLDNNKLLALDGLKHTNLDSIFTLCKELKSTLLPDSVLITCEGFGVIKLGDAWKEVERKVGRDHISQDSLFTEEDGKKIFWRFETKLWKDTEREISVGWNELTEYNQTFDQLSVLNPSISYLTVSSPQSIYRFFNGLRIGSTIQEVVKLNGGSPIFFNVDSPCEEIYYVIDFNKGTLSKKIPLDIFHFELNHEGGFNPQKAIPSLDSLYSYCQSDDPGLVHTNSRSKISSISIGN